MAEDTGSRLSSDIKVARPDIMIGITDVDVSGMAYVTFQDLGGIELIDTVRHDEVRTINGLKEPIADINDFIKKFNSGNILPPMEGARKTFSKFDYDLDSYIPKYADITDQNVRVEGKSIIIELVNLPRDVVGDLVNKVEIEILGDNGTIHDIIY
jgi:hypothetical protein